jgi:hypothetical protein
VVLVARVWATRSENRTAHTSRRVLLGACRAPAAFVLGTRGNRVRNGAHDDANFTQLVRDNAGLLGVDFLAPKNLELGTDLNVGVNGCQRKTAALVGAVASEERCSNNGASGVYNTVEVRRAVVSVGQVEELSSVLGGAEQRCHDLTEVFSVPGQGDLLALLSWVELLQCVATDEVVIELDEGAVAELPGVEVVVLDVVGNERTSKCVGCFVAVSGEPLAVAALSLAGVDSWQWRRNPAGLEGVRLVGARTNRLNTELATSFEDGVTDALGVLVGTPDLEAGGASHTVTEGANLDSTDV